MALSQALKGEAQGDEVRGGGDHLRPYFSTLPTPREPGGAGLKVLGVGG
jgi:hypothetical protein